MPNYSNNLSRRLGSFQVLTLISATCFGGLGPARAQIYSDQSDPNPNAGPATPAKEFGDRGVVVIGGDIGVTNLSYSNSDASEFSVVAAPGFDYFIGRPVSIGGYVRASYSDHKGYDYFGPLMESKETDMVSTPEPLNSPVLKLTFSTGGWLQ